MRSRLTTFALLWTLLVVTPGCENIRGLLGDKPPVESVPLARTLDRQIMELDLLSTVPYQDRIDIYTAIELDFANEPSDANRLRLALAKSVEGHANTDLAASYKGLQQLLQSPNTLSPTQVHLANIVSRRVEDSLIANAELNALRSELASFKSANSAQSSQADRRVRELRSQLKSVEEDNARLKEELSQAQRQLDAIMSIETSTDPGQ